MNSLPDLPKTSHILYQDDATGTEVAPPTLYYTAAQMHQYAREYAATLSQTAGVAEAVRSYLMSNDLYSLLTDIQNGIDSPATMGTANSLIIRLDRLREMLAAATAAQQTDGVVLARGWFHALPDEDDYEFHDDASGAGKNCDGCIRAMIVAAPAASGGEDDRSGWCRSDGCVHKKFGEPTWKEGDNPFQSSPHPDALPDGTLSKSTAKRVEALAASGGECPTLHPATEDLIRRFSDALREKLSAAEKKYGYSDGWASPDWMDQCRRHLDQHVAKGDPRDVAAYCAFLWHHGEPTTKRDRDADRKRFPDDDFNAWLDAGISDAGHTVYDSLSSIEDAWQGWHGHVLSVMIDENPVFDDLAIDSLTAAASVSERARELLAAEYDRDNDPELADGIRNAPELGWAEARAVRAIEQALTQQRGECEPLGYTALFNAIAAATWPQTKGVGINVSVDRFRDSIGGDVFTTPQPSADAVREVIGSMRNFADVADKCELTEGNAQVAIRAWATQLESLLSGGSHA